MALPNRNNIITMDWSQNGSPWVSVAAKSGISLDGLDWSKDGSPWWGLEISILPKFIPSNAHIFAMMGARR